MVYSYFVAEHATQSLCNLFCKGNFGQHEKHLFSTFQSFGYKMDVYFGLSCRCDTVQKCYVLLSKALLYLFKSLFLCFVQGVLGNDSVVAVYESANLYFVAFEYSFILKFLVYVRGYLRFLNQLVL